jgi:ParB/RepB/Spo0J family partition protein
MTKAVLSKPATPPASVAPSKILYQGPVKIEIIDLFGNVRKEFDAAKDKELAESIASKGVISPVTLRPHPKIGNRYLLVAGHRRLSAAKVAGLVEIPAIVRQADDEEALILQIEENIQRKDLGPIEEAKGFQLLTRAGKDGAPAKYTAEQLGQLVDKSTGYVYRAMALLELPEEAIAAIQEGTITPAHGHQILRVPPFEREALVKSLLEEGYDGRIDTAVELRYRVEGQLACDLASAKFPKDKTYAGADACTNCPSNTGNQGMLFVGAEKGSCLNRQCFEIKTKQHRADFLEKTTLANLGSKFVEYARGGVYEGMNRTGGYVVRGKFDAKKPPKGDYGLLIDQTYEVWYASVDRKAMEQGKDGPIRADPTERLIEERTEQAVLRAAVKAAAKNPKKALQVVARYLIKGLYSNNVRAIHAFELQNDIPELEKRIEKGTVPELVTIVTALQAINQYQHEDFASELGVKLQDVEKATAAAVRKELAQKAAMDPAKAAEKALDKMGIKKKA